MSSDFCDHAVHRTHETHNSLGYDFWRAIRGCEATRNTQWRRSVVKYEGHGQSGEAIKLFQAPRKISVSFHFWHESFVLDDVKLAEVSSNSF